MLNLHLPLNQPAPNLRSNNMSVEQKNLTVVILFSFIIVAVLYFVVKPLTGQLAKQYKENKTKNQELIIAKDELVDLEKFAKEFETKKPKIDKMLNYLPQDSSTNFTTQAEALAQSSGNTLTSIKFPTAADQKTKTTSTVSGVDESKFEIELEGNFGSFVRFLSGLTQLAQINNATGIELQYTPEKTKAKINGSVYQRKATK